VREIVRDVLGKYQQRVYSKRPGGLAQGGIPGQGPKQGLWHTWDQPVVQTPVEFEILASSKISDTDRGGSKQRNQWFGWRTRKERGDPKRVEKTFGAQERGHKKDWGHRLS